MQNVIINITGKELAKRIHCWVMKPFPKAKFVVKHLILCIYLFDPEPSEFVKSEGAVVVFFCIV